MSLLTRPHMAVGNGQHLVCAAMALASFLGSVQLWGDMKETPQPVPGPVQLTRIPTQPDGRCFFTCMFLAMNCTSKHQKQWMNVQRNNVGFPLEPARMEVEDKGFCARTVYACLLHMFTHMRCVYICIYIYTN